MQLSVDTRSRGQHHRWMEWATVILLLLMAGCASSNIGGRVTDANAPQRIATAATAADHEALATYYRKKAEETADWQVGHEQMILESYKQYARAGDIGSSRDLVRDSMRTHCRELIKLYRAVQEKYLSLSKEHASLARKLVKAHLN